MTYFRKITLVAGFRVVCREARVKAGSLVRKPHSNLRRDAGCPLLRQKTQGGANLGCLRNEKSRNYYCQRHFIINTLFSVLTF